MITLPLFVTMPTLVLLDVSLSMSRNVQTPDSCGEVSIKSLATSGLIAFFDYLASNCRLEQTSLMFFSSLWEKAIPFTRDYESLKLTLLQQEALYDTTNIRNVLSGVQEVVAEEWGVSCAVPINVILVSDGLIGIRADDDSKWPLPYPFPTRLHVVCISPSNDPSLNSSIPYYEKLIELSGVSRGSVDSHLWIPDGNQLSEKSVEKMFIKLAEDNYSGQKGRLVCGNLSCPVSLFPPIESQTQQADFDILTFRPSNDIKVFGFLEISEITSPAVLSRHLMFPLPMNRDQFLSSQPSVFNITSDGTSQDPMGENGDETPAGEEGRQPSLCVLLHGALKVEGMVAMCTIGTCISGSGEVSSYWYGMLYSWADSKKKFNLMLSTFRGRDDESIPWMGNLKNLGNPLLNLKLPDAEKKKVVKSYSQQGVVVWVKQSWIQSDIQKIVRLAKRLPEKSSNFYKELSRFRRAAASSGFYEILSGMAGILERESASNPPTEATEHLNYAVRILRSPDAYDVDIPPLKLN